MVKILNFRTHVQSHICKSLKLDIGTGNSCSNLYLDSFSSFDSPTFFFIYNYVMDKKNSLQKFHHTGGTESSNQCGEKHRYQKKVIKNTKIIVESWNFQLAIIYKCLQKVAYPKVSKTSHLKKNILASLKIQIGINRRYK